MKDYKTLDVMKQKRERAIGLLKALGIWRGQSDCKHVYRDSKGSRRDAGRAFSADPRDGMNHG